MCQSQPDETDFRLKEEYDCRDIRTQTLAASGRFSYLLAGSVRTKKAGRLPIRVYVGSAKNPIPRR